MIELKIEPYCQNCNEFELDVKTISCEHLPNMFNGKIIKCKHANRCKRIANFLRKRRKYYPNVALHANTTITVTMTLVALTTTVGILARICCQKNVVANMRSV